MTQRFLGRVLIYSIVGCRHCCAAKHSLEELGIPFTDVSIDKYESQVRESVKELTGKTTVPQIFFNEVLIGGNDSLQKLITNSAEWAKMVKKLEKEAPPSNAPQPPPDSLKLPETEGSDAGDFLCEPDEYAQLVQELQSTALIGDHRKGIFNHKNTFSGSDFVQWLTDTKGVDEAEAVKKGQYLVDHHFAHPVKHRSDFSNDDKLYRLVIHDEAAALNQQQMSQCEALSVSELGERLRTLILRIYNNYLSSDGKRVDYSGIGKSSEFKSYETLTLSLQRAEVESASREEKLAFFINIYNALVIHANVARGPPTNMWQRYKYFNHSRYVIGGHSYSLQDIENGVLRGNRKGVGMIFKPFGSSDPRLKVALETAEPLIHFALVCGAKSCPPIKTYSADGIMAQLKLAAESFLEGDDFLVDIDKNLISLSKIFSWYKEDFGGSDQSLLSWIADHMSVGEKRANLEKMIVSGNYKIAYQPYDWSTNS